MQVYTGVPLDLNESSSSSSDIYEGKAQQPCPSIVSYIQETDEEEATLLDSEYIPIEETSVDKYASFTFQWWRTIVAIMISINTIATHFLVQDEINGYMVAGDYHTLLQIVALFYIIQCPGTIVLYFLCNHREDFQYGCCDLFNFFVVLVTILQNWVCLTMIYYIYFI